MNKIYKDAYINGLISYLNYCVKEGYIEEETAEEIVIDKDWARVEKIRDDADAFAEAIMEGNI